jgi:hypothetical protein
MNNKNHLIFSFFTFLFSRHGTSTETEGRRFPSCCRCFTALAACDWETTDSGGNYQRFDWDIEGTWKTNESESRYTGTLIIDDNRITITGYSETQPPVRFQKSRVSTLHIRQQTGDPAEAISTQPPARPCK